MSCPWLNLNTVIVSRCSPFLTDQPRSLRIKDLTSKNTPWRIKRLGHGRMQSIFMAIVVTKEKKKKKGTWGKQWCSLDEEDAEPQTTIALCSYSNAIPQFYGLCSRPQTIKPRNIISLWPTQKLAFSSLLLSQSPPTAGIKVNSCNNEIP